MSSCGDCKQQVEISAKSKIVCVNCNSIFHPSCVNLKDIEVEVLQGKEWNCPKCVSKLRLQRAKPDSTPVKQAQSSSASRSGGPVTLGEMTHLLSNLKDELLGKLGSEIAAVLEKLEANSAEITKQQSQIDSLVSENLELKSRLLELEYKQDEQEQYGRRNTIEVFGVPETEGENCYDRVLDIGKALNVALDHTSIDACHRLPKNKNMSTSGIIVRFVRRGDKDALLTKRRLCKSFTTNNINMGGNHTIYLNQSLTPRRRKLFAMAKKAQSEKVVRHVWADRVGRVKVRKEDAGKIYILKSEDDLKKLSLENN